MSQIQEELREAFEAEGYEIGEVTANRKQIRIALQEERAEGAKLRDIVHDVAGEENVLRLDITTESIEGEDAIQTVVSFQSRA